MILFGQSMIDERQGGITGRTRTSNASVFMVASAKSLACFFVADKRSCCKIIVDLESSAFSRVIASI